MAVTHTTAVRNAVCTAVANQLTAGSSFAGPLIRFKTGSTPGAGSVAATLTMSATPFAAPASGEMVSNAITPDSSATGNASPVAHGEITNRDGTACVYFSLATSGGDINLNSVTINNGVQVSLSQFTYRAMA